MHDPIIKEMEAAYAEATHKKGDTHEERKAAVTQAVQKYFRPGMKTDDAFKLLRQLKEHGFEIKEYRYEGARVWPDGELKPFLGEVGKLTYQRHHPKGVSRFIAIHDKTRFTIQTLFVTRRAAINFRVEDGSEVIADVEGDVEFTGI